MRCAVRWLGCSCRGHNREPARLEGILKKAHMSLSTRGGRIIPNGRQKWVIKIQVKVEVISISDGATTEKILKIEEATYLLDNTKQTV